MEITYDLQIDKQTEKAFKQMPDTLMFEIAKMTLDLTYPIIPKDTKKMALETVANGVKGSDGDYYLESSPEYASHVWNMDDVTTNWTTPGTHSQWFARTLEENGQTIIDASINKAWKETM